MNEKIKAYSSTITAVFSALVVLYGVFKFVNTGNDNSVATKELKQTLKVIQADQKKANIKLDSIENTVKGLDVVVQKIDVKVGRVSNQFTLHLSKDKSITKDDLIQIINEINEKKN